MNMKMVNTWLLGRPGWGRYAKQSRERGDKIWQWKEREQWRQLCQKLTHP